MRANVIYANGVLRRRLGAAPRIQDGFGPAALGKLAVARGAKALNLQTPHVRHLPVTFGLDAARPGCWSSGVRTSQNISTSGLSSRKPRSVTPGTPGRRCTVLAQSPGSPDGYAFPG